MTNFNERTNTLLYKNIPLTLYSRKGDVSCVWEVSGDKDGLLFWPKVLLSTIAALLPHLSWVAQLRVTEGPKLAVCRWLSIWHLVSNWLQLQLTQAVCVLVIFLFDALLLPLFFRLFTQVHLLIDGSVEGQYVTQIELRIYLTWKIYVEKNY